jgi:micrococcal nuclease
MTFFRSRFLIAVLTITAIIISLMALLRMRLTSSYRPKTYSPPSRGLLRVSRVVDGDTLILDNGETVRLIGVDAPEAHHPEVPVQRFGTEATEFLRRLAQGFECTLEYEPSQIRDKYGRLLAYVFVEERLINAEMIRRGYAYAYTRFPFRRQAEFLALEREARQRQYGLWNLSLRDGRIANLVKRYESLNREGRRKLDRLLEKLVQKYPSEEEGRLELPINREREEEKFEKKRKN